LRYFGAISYSLYLWQELFVTADRTLVGSGSNHAAGYRSAVGDRYRVLSPDGAPDSSD